MTDTWGAKRKRMLSGKRSRADTAGGGGDRKRQGAERDCFSAGQNSNMIILKGSA